MILGENRDYFVRFQVFTAASVKTFVFWVVMPCTYCLSELPRRTQGPPHYSYRKTGDTVVATDLKKLAGSSFVLSLRIK
jgi:hypothetical protein